jgi:hypothetical protein
VCVRRVYPGAHPFEYRQETIDGLNGYISHNNYFQCTLSLFFHPTLDPEEEYIAPAFAPNPKREWIFISHGVGGNADLYSHLCNTLSAEGYVVCILEHEDGSASSARRPDGTLIPCDFGFGVGEMEVAGMLSSKITQRVNELCNVVNALLPSGASYCLLGHSFGASTVYCALSKLRPRKVVMYDLWMEPLSFYFNPRYEYIKGSIYAVPDYPTLFRGASLPAFRGPLLHLSSRTFDDNLQTKKSVMFFKYRKMSVIHRPKLDINHVAMIGDILFILPCWLVWLCNLGSYSQLQRVVVETMLFLKSRP